MGQRNYNSQVDQQPRFLQVPVTLATLNYDPTPIRYPDPDPGTEPIPIGASVSFVGIAMHGQRQTFASKPSLLSSDGGGGVEGGRGVVGACLCLCLRSLPFYLFFRTKPKRQKERKKEIMMGAQKYLPDDLDVKEQKDAHIGSDSRCDKKLTFLFNL